MKHFDERVTQKLGEILTKHGRSPLTDPRLCESLLKDYCGEYKEEISLLVSAVRERIAIDLLISRDSIPWDLLRALLINRLRRNRSLSESAARWAVESWSLAVLTLSSAESRPTPNESVGMDGRLSSPLHNLGALRTSLPEPATKFGILGQCKETIRSVACSPFADRIASGGEDSIIRLWQAHSGEMRILGRCDGPVTSVAFSPNGVMIASASEGGVATKSEVLVWDLQSGEGLALGECGERAPSVVFSPGGKRLASGSAEPQGVLRVWNLQTGQVRVLKGPWDGPASISFSPDGNGIAAADGTLSNAAIRLWDLETGTARTLGHSRRQITSVAFSPDGKSVASGSWDETVRLWNVRTGEGRVLGKNCSCICRLAFSPKGDAVAACSLDNRIRVWDVETARSRTVGECHSVNDVAFLDGGTLVTGSGDGTLRLWDASL